MKLTKQIVSFASGIDGSKADNILPIKNAKMTYNFAFIDGSLVSGVGFKGLNCPFATQSALSNLTLSLESMGCVGAIFYFRKYDFEAQKWTDKLILFDGEFNAFYIDILDENPTLNSLGFKFSSRPFGVNYRLNSEDVFILASEDDSMIVWDGKSEIEVVADAPHISSMAIHFERLFVTTAGDKSEMWFSDDLDPTNWNVSLDDAGFIQMVDERGSLRRVISFNNYVYVFRDFGISRLSASSSQENFFLSHLFVSSGKILEKSICVCGDRIIFLTTEGLYQFDGSSTTKILGNLSNILRGNQKTSACFLNGKYYLSCRVDFGDDNYSDDDQKTNAILIMNVTTREYEIVRGISVVDMVALLSSEHSKIVIATNDPNLPIVEVADIYGYFANVPLKKVWRSALTDLNYPNKLKTLRRFHLSLKGCAYLTIASEQESVTIKLQDGVNSYSLLISGKQFSFEFYSEDNNVQLSDLMLEFYI